MNQLQFGAIRSMIQEVEESRGYKHSDSMLMDTVSLMAKIGDATSVNRILAEMVWKSSRRPFFNMYPAVVRSLLNTSLDVDLSLIPRSAIHELGSVLVRLPDRGIPDDLLSVGSFMAHISSGTIDPVSMEDVESEGTLIGSVDFSFHCGDSWFTNNRRLDQRFSSVSGRLNASGDEESLMSQPTVNAITKIGIGVLLLAADPEYATPVILKKDRHKNKSIESLADKARRRGVVGWDIGKDIEVLPHYRRPHFALRWTGKGRSVPKLSYIKGCAVNRGRLTEVPTGYLDKENPE